MSIVLSTKDSELVEISFEGEKTIELFREILSSLYSEKKNDGLTGLLFDLQGLNIPIYYKEITSDVNNT